MSKYFFRRSRSRASARPGADSSRRLRLCRTVSQVESLESREMLSGLSWSAGATMPAARGNSAALETGAGVLVIGGAASASGNANSSAAYLFDPFGGSWTTAPAADQGRNGAGLGATGSLGPIVVGNEGANYKYTSDIFLFGGATQGQPTSSVVNYSTSVNGEITNAPAMSTARSLLAYATDPATGDLYAIGGLGAGSSVLSSVERYDPQTDSWSTVAPLPQPMYRAAATIDGAGHIFVFGGDNSAAAPVNTVYEYNVVTDTWTSAGAMPKALAGAAAVYGAYGQIYVVGGLAPSGPVADVSVYDPVTDQWSSETPLPSAKYGASAVVDSNGSLDVFGGFDSLGNGTSTLYQSQALPAPVGLPAVPQVTIDPGYFTYDGASHAAVVTVVAADGYTPVDGLLTLTYDGSSSPPVNAGAYAVLATFTSNDPNYVSTVVQGTMVIDAATPTLSVAGGGTIAYDGSPHPISAVAWGVDGVTHVSGTIAYTYNGSAAAPVNPGTYTALATFTSSDPNYADASASTTITIPDPTIPTGVTAAGASTTSIRVSWNPVAGAAYYNIYERHVLHSPKGSGSTITYPLVVGHVTDTSATITVSPLRGYTFYVTSVSGTTGAESPRSAPASGEGLFAASLSSMLWGGAVTSYAAVEVGQTLQVTLLGYGNEPPTYSLVSGPSAMSVDPVSGVVTYTPAAAEAGNVSATFRATNSLGTATATFQFHVLAQPVIVVQGGTFTFDGNTHSATATAFASDGVTPISGTFNIVYSPAAYPTALSTAPYAQAGSYLVQATFSSSDPNYGGGAGTASITILPASPTVVLTNESVDYDGLEHGLTATAVGVDGVTPIAGTFTYSYNGSPNLPVNQGSYHVVATFTSADGNYIDATASATLTIGPPFSPAASVAGVALFYRGSTAWDVTNTNLPGFSDDNAIALDKTAYLPSGGAATFVNVSSYMLGINGLMVDLAGAHGTITANDFVFKVGNNNAPDTWGVAPAPTLVSTRVGAGAGGSDRIELVWPDGAIQRTWLEVVVRGNDAQGGSNSNAGLAASDVFFFGSAPADSGFGDTTGFMVSTIDDQLVRNHPAGHGNPASIDNPYDFNRDGLVNAIDQAAVRSFTSNAATALKFLNVSAAGPFAPTSNASASMGAIATALALGPGSTSSAASMVPSPAVVDSTQRAPTSRQFASVVHSAADDTTESADSKKSADSDESADSHVGTDQIDDDLLELLANRE
jgi:hypothetical protein